MEWWHNCFLILLFIYLKNYYYNCYDNYFSSSIWCTHVLTIKLVSFNYLHVICELEKEFPLDYLEGRTVAVLGTAGSGPKISAGILFEVFINQIILQFVFRQNSDASKVVLCSKWWIICQFSLHSWAAQEKGMFFNLFKYVILQV